MTDKLARLKISLDAEGLCDKLLETQNKDPLVLSMTSEKVSIGA
jgi:hypothetical protein